MNEEVWKIVPGWDLYEASTHGRVRSIRSGKIMSQNKDKDGYLRLNLSINGRRKNWRVHLLIMLTFEGPMPSDKNQVAHWDGSQENNRFENLRYAVGVENCEDRARHGRQHTGETHFSAKLSDEEAQRIFEDRKTSSLTISELSEKYGTSRATIKKIIYAEGRFSFLEAHPLTNAKSPIPSRGATFIARLRKWQAQITFAGTSEYLGLFESKEEAQAAYLTALSNHRAAEETL